MRNWFWILMCDLFYWAGIRCSNAASYCERKLYRASLSPIRIFFWAVLSDRFAGLDNVCAADYQYAGHKLFKKEM